MVKTSSEFKLDFPLSVEVEDVQLDEGLVGDGKLVGAWYIIAMRGLVCVVGKGTLLAFGFIILIHISAFLFIREHDLFIDEHYHYRQIVRFINGDRTPDPLLSMIPGYHWTVVAIANIAHVTRFQDIRVISFVLNLLTIPIFYLAAKEIDKQSALLKTLQFSVFPLVFPYFSLIYTDIFSVLFILATLWTIYTKRYFVAGIVISLSILARQNNIFWLIFFFLFIYVKNFGWHVTAKSVVKHLGTTRVFALGPLLFVDFLILNGGMTVGDRQLMYLNLTNQSNVFIVVGLFLVLFLPLLASYSRELVRLVWHHKKKFVLLVPIFYLYQLWFTNSHPYNQTRYFLHNVFALYATADIWHKLIFFSIIVVAVGLLFLVRLHERAGYLLYPITIIFLLPIWFMEWRYYVIPYIIFLMLRKTRGAKIEYAMLLYFFALSVYFYQGILREVFFL